ncbi:RNA polymerase sigma factor [Geofilum rubicundum]|uniref:RNA polymerase ECF-type sigma factor n=1 Tax=Geofilum rubicundum JCM 15548 TaxID=1236989 RepID=A0A0E9M232_9BACT|nr:sigma-70 family RNA polymerase sigma factor [Geofilum rubicundum]GAO31569.1 RNA polymerase ECF-type sigma factor [Geofilum rubicundum JCM 15548]
MAKIEQIIEGCQKGRRDAQKQLYELFSPQLFAVCLRYTHNRMEAEDHLHEGYLKIFDKIGQFSGRGPVEAWMRRVMVNTILESFRKKAKYSFVDESNIPLEEDLNQEQEQEDDESAINIHEIENLIEQLPERYKLVFKLYILDNYTHDEIARELGISVGTSKSNLARARQWLKTRIEKMQADKAKALW